MLIPLSSSRVESCVALPGEAFSVCLPFHVSRFFLSIPRCQTQKITLVSLGYGNKNSARGGSHLAKQLLSIASGSARPPFRVCVRAQGRADVRLRQQCSPPAFSYSSTGFTAPATLAHMSCFQFLSRPQRGDTAALLSVTLVRCDPQKPETHVIFIKCHVGVAKHLQAIKRAQGTGE